MNYRVFEPPGDALQIVTMGKIFGSTLASTGPLEGDHVYKAQEVANQTGSLVLAYELPGTSDSQTLASACRIGKEIDKLGNLPVVVTGISMDGANALRIVAAEQFPVDSVTLYDPAENYDYSALGLCWNWAWYQLMDEQRKPASQNNQHPQSTQAPWSQIDWAKNKIRILRDTASNLDTLKRCMIPHYLYRIAEGASFQQTTVRAEFPGHTFTSGPRPSAKPVNSINSYRTDPDAASFEAIWSPDKYHSWANDPWHVAELVAKVRQLKQTRDKRS